LLDGELSRDGESACLTVKDVAGASLRTFCLLESMNLFSYSSVSSFDQVIL
jgi:hypothetical protein